MNTNDNLWHEGIPQQVYVYIYILTHKGNKQKLRQHDAQ